MRYIPITPSGTACDWLEAETEAEAWNKLIEDAAHMPYKTKEGFIERGYRIGTADPEPSFHEFKG